MSEAESSREAASSSPDGDVYDWYQRGCQLLVDRHPDAAATLLARAAAAEPGSRSIREALGRAQYDAGRYQDAIDSFTDLITLDPTDDYAHFGLGLAADRARRLPLAAEHLALAAAMRPDLPHYARALRGVRARLLRETA
ncbi:tetratricopeptide repeat protein [Blastococcus sp. LR1]|uniref:tetratricopeptide repeat protein n=1 Tax=Blastococcus sp. LR1 TaxID=2877000 RepID=UPI001CCD2706|nr:tetratricopeptide repeat protein [Blastococcus sp. LR1]MCA0145638.1 tetratricopeptide repeat protein [Blastococcus sp. LR1]